MKKESAIPVAPLEDRLFKNALYIGFVAVLLLLVTDALINNDFMSLFIEIATGLFIIGNFLIVQNRPASSRQRYIFSFFLAFAVNFGWIVGGGISILLSSIYFLALGFILMINDGKYYKIIFTIFCVNYALLFSMEYFFHFNLSSEYIVNKEFLIKDYLVTLIFYLFGGYFIYFLKLNYNNERESLNRANDLLKEKAIEISNQNEELKTSKEVLDETIDRLELQRMELMDIKGSLEIKIQERTNDLLNVNERLLAQNQQLEQYTYITSHNLRAPIAQIKGLIHLLPVQKNFDSLTLETLQRLNESAVNLEKVFYDLSQIIDVEKGMQQPWEKINFVSEIQKVLDSLKSSIDEKQITIIMPEVDVLFNVNSLRPYVYSIFHNIIENAVKYSDQKKDNPYIKIELSESSKYFVVSINDNGIGIDMEMANSKIFQMYQRFNDTHPGQGFGLFLVKSQMEALGGNVELESVFGQGTTFSLYFPKGKSKMSV